MEYSLMSTDAAFWPPQQYLFPSLMRVQYECIHIICISIYIYAYIYIYTYLYLHWTNSWLDWTLDTKLIVFGGEEFSQVVNDNAWGSHGYCSWAQLGLGDLVELWRDLCRVGDFSQRFKWYPSYAKIIKDHQGSSKISTWLFEEWKQQGTRFNPTERRCAYKRCQCPIIALCNEYALECAMFLQLTSNLNEISLKRNAFPWSKKWRESEVLWSSTRSAKLRGSVGISWTQHLEFSSRSIFVIYNVCGTIITLAVSSGYSTSLFDTSKPAR